MKTKNIPIKQTKQFTLVVSLLLSAFIARSQTITKDVSSIITGTVCPVLGTRYTISSLGIYGSCSRQWTATNGKINGDATELSVSVSWDDTPGAAPTLKCTLSGCTDSDGKAIDGKDVTFVEDKLILSVRNQA
jgi:hypothetical protein